MFFISHMWTATATIAIQARASSFVSISSSFASISPRFQIFDRDKYKFLHLYCIVNNDLTWDDNDIQHHFPSNHPSVSCGYWGKLRELVWPCFSHNLLSFHEKEMRLTLWAPLPQFLSDCHVCSRPLPLPLPSMMVVPVLHSLSTPSPNCVNPPSIGVIIVPSCTPTLAGCDYSSTKANIDLVCNNLHWVVES